MDRQIDNAHASRTSAPPSRPFVPVKRDKGPRLVAVRTQALARQFDATCQALESYFGASSLTFGEPTATYVLVAPRSNQKKTPRPR